MKRKPHAALAKVGQAEKAANAPPAHDVPKIVQTAGSIEFELRDPPGKTIILSGPHRGDSLLAIVGSVDGRNYLASIYQLVPARLQTAIRAVFDEEG